MVKETNERRKRFLPGPQRGGPAETEDSLELGSYGQPRNACQVYRELTVASRASREDLCRQAERAPLICLYPQQPHLAFPGSKPEDHYPLDRMIQDTERPNQVER